MWTSAWQPKQTFPFHLVHWCFPLQQARPTPQSQCFSILEFPSNSNNICWLDRVAVIASTFDWKWFSVTAIFGSDGTGGMVIDWDASCFSSCSSNWVICSLRIVFHRSFGRLLVTCILILHFLCEHLYSGTQLVNHLPQLSYRQLDNNQVNYSESQKSVLRQETVCTFCWLWGNAPNVVILGASVCPGVGCYNLVLLSLGKPHSPKYFSIIIYASPLICGANLNYHPWRSIAWT